MISSINKYLFYFLLPLLFCQIWLTSGGITIRLEDIVLIFLNFFFFLPLLYKHQFKIRAGNLDIAIYSYIVIIFIGIVVTLYNNTFTDLTHKDALVNGIRLILSFTIFPIIINNANFNTEDILRIINVILFFSILTTIISFLQLLYWSGIINIGLPELFVRVHEDANTQKGREIYGLFVGDGGAHKWASILAIQAIILLNYIKYNSKGIKKIFGYLFLAILLIILVNISVRNAILGLIVALLINFFINVRNQDIFKRLYKPIIAMISLSILILIAYQYAGSYVINRVLVALPSIEDGGILIDRASNIFGRFEYARVAIEIFKDYPLMGAGYYSFSGISHLYSITGSDYPHVHNSILHILCEHGIIGFISFFMFLYMIFKTYRKNIQRLSVTPCSLLLINIVRTLFIFFLFTSLFSHPFGVPRLILILLIFTAFLSKLYNLDYKR